MPELPEVETIRRIIEPQIKGRQILSICVENAQVIASPDTESFCRRLKGCTFSGMGRRGKFLQFYLDNGDRMILHLRMTGQLLITPRDYPKEKHTHLILDLSGEQQLRYIDVRRFGRFWLFEKDEKDDYTGMDRLGPEPDDPGITAAYLMKKLSGTNKPIKEALHDQSIITGIGNIYSDEILFAARINPQTRCSDLDTNDWQRLSEEIPAVIRWGIDANRMTPEEYLAGKGKEYRNTSGLKVYGRAGSPCIVCGNLLKKTVIGGRSSCWCSNCQREHKHEDIC